jgi:hypothetical protein
MLFYEALARIKKVAINIVLIRYLMIFPGARVHGFDVVPSYAF